jgi:hypothetical protein
MRWTTTPKIFACCVLMLMFMLQATAQNKDIDKGKEELTKAFQQKDAQKKQEGIAKAKEMLQKGGMKPQEMAVLLGDAYLDNGDLVNAQNSYGAASKEDKKEGLKKVADAMVDAAFSGDEKQETKSVNKAMQLYEKAGAGKEGARNIGDKYYAKGAAGLDKALDFYIRGDASAKLEGIAKEYFDKGGDNENKAAEIYLKLKTPEGYQKAGDIYYNKKEYQKASEAYIAGNNAEGIRKYANYLYAQNRNEEADNMFVKLAKIYSNQKDDAALEKLANECTSKGSYMLASRIYDQAGNTTMSDKCKAYDKLITFDLDSAKLLFGSVGDQPMVKAINDNTKLLTPLKDVSDNFEELMKNAPAVNVITDSVTGISKPSEADQKTLEDYYKSIRDQIIKNVYAVSAGYAKLTDADLKKFTRQRFLQFGAIRNILDNETFAIKKQKQDIKVKDVVL